MQSTSERDLARLREGKDCYPEDAAFALATRPAVNPSCDHAHMPTSAQVLSLLDDGYVR